MEDWEGKLARVYASVDCYVRYRLNGSPDAEDIVQEVCLTAYRKADQLLSPDAFKAWILQIARNRCNDYYRKHLRLETVPLDDVEEKLIYSRQGLVCGAVEDTLERLSRRDREILHLCY